MIVQLFVNLHVCPAELCAIVGKMCFIYLRIPSTKQRACCRESPQYLFEESVNEMRSRKNLFYFLCLLRLAYLLPPPQSVLRTVLLVSTV